jgi:hypothetical protein
MIAGQDKGPCANPWILSIHITLDNRGQVSSRNNAGALDKSIACPLILSPASFLSRAHSNARVLLRASWASCPWLFLTPFQLCLVLFTFNIPSRLQASLLIQRLTRRISPDPRTHVQFKYSMSLDARYTAHYIRTTIVVHTLTADEQYPASDNICYYRYERTLCSAPERELQADNSNAQPPSIYGNTSQSPLRPCVILTSSQCHMVVINRTVSQNEIMS